MTANTVGAMSNEGILDDEHVVVKYGDLRRLQTAALEL